MSALSKPAIEKLWYYLCRLYKVLKLTGLLVSEYNFKDDFS